jgi:hypothetical protein
MLHQVFYFILPLQAFITMPEPLKKYLIIVFVLCVATFTNGQDSLNISNSDIEIMEFLLGNGIPVTYINNLTLLKSVKEKFVYLFPHIQQEKHHIHL